MNNFASIIAIFPEKEHILHIKSRQFYLITFFLKRLINFTKIVSTHLVFKFKMSLSNKKYLYVLYKSERTTLITHNFAIVLTKTQWESESQLKIE